MSGFTPILKLHVQFKRLYVLYSYVHVITLYYIFALGQPVQSNVINTYMYIQHHYIVKKTDYEDKENNQFGLYWW